MGIVKWNAAIEYVKGSLAKPKKVDGHKHGSYLIGTHREAPTQNPNCTRVYTRGAEAYDRSTPVTATELAVRTKFSAVSAQVATAMKGAGVTQYLNEFNAQKDLPGGKKTMKAFLWKKFGDVYDENQG